MSIELLDTDAFSDFLSNKSDWLKRYKALVKDYNETIKDLKENWKGKGSDAFQKDAAKVKANLVGIQDILETMCDTLEDCYEIFRECDKSLGSLNRESAK